MERGTSSDMQSVSAARRHWRDVESIDVFLIYDIHFLHVVKLDNVQVMQFKLKDAENVHVRQLLRHGS